jgi:hypothetical protein
VSDLAVRTHRERDAHRFNERGKRPGIYGESIDRASGTELDRQAAVFGVERDRRKRWIFVTRESDESLRGRVFMKYQRESAPAPCVHNVWIGYDTGTKCDDCGEWLCFYSKAEAAKIPTLNTLDRKP